MKVTEEIAKEWATKCNMLNEYLLARRHGYSIVEALYEWDLVPDEYFGKIY